MEEGPNPLKLKVNFVYAGSKTEYLSFLAEGNQLMNQICGIIALIGGIFITWHFLSKKKKPQQVPLVKKTGIV